MSHTTFKSIYDCLPLRQTPLAFQGRDVGQMAIPASQNDHPRVRRAPAFGLPIGNTGRAKAQGFGEVAKPAFMGDGFSQNIHTHDFNTTVSFQDSQMQRQDEGMNKISLRMKEARTRKGWNQAQLALAAGVSPGTIGNIESGTRQAKGSLPQIAKALGISHDWLANGEGEMMDGQASAADGEPGPSSQAALLAMLFDRLDNDLLLRAQVYNKTTQIIIDAIQGTDSQKTPVQEPQNLAKRPS